MALDLKIKSKFEFKEPHEIVLKSKKSLMLTILRIQGSDPVTIRCSTKDITAADGTDYHGKTFYLILIILYIIKF
jgi:hypothetical protein